MMTLNVKTLGGKREYEWAGANVVMTLIGFIRLLFAPTGDPECESDM